VIEDWQVIFVERGWDGNDKGARRFRFEGSAEVAAIDRLSQGILEPRFGDMRVAVVEIVNQIGLYVDADNVEAGRGERDGRWQSDVSQSDDAHVYQCC
jgi:hypothetical protein